MDNIINSNIIKHLTSADKKLAKVIYSIGSLNIVEHSDSFYFLVREIVGQMISSGVKKVIFGRLLDLCSGELTPIKINALDFDSLRGIGLSQNKAHYIKNLAEYTLCNKIDFDSLKNLTDEEVISTLMRVKGIGIWTSKMYLIFYLKREDVLPEEDGAFMQAFRWLYNYPNPDQKTVEHVCKIWKPYSSIGARYLYAALDTGLTKIPIETFLKES